MWLEQLGANRFWMSLWWVNDKVSVHPRLKLTTVGNATWASVLTGRSISVARISDEWLRQFDVESHKHHDNI
jgi:hypothetical protein